MSHGIWSVISWLLINFWRHHSPIKSTMFYIGQLTCCSWLIAGFSIDIGEHFHVYPGYGWRSSTSLEVVHWKYCMQGTKDTQFPCSLSLEYIWNYWWGARVNFCLQILMSKSLPFFGKQDWNPRSPYWDVRRHTISAAEKNLELYQVPFFHVFIICSVIPGSFSVC